MKYLATAYVFSIAMLICCGNKRGDQQLNETPIPAVSVQNDLPSFEITFSDGKKASVKSLTGKLALVLFQPDCDHCQREAQDIRNHLSSFKDFKLYFISSAETAEINKFAQDYKLAGIPNVSFARTEAQNIVSAFGPIEAPSIYLYNQQGGLIESFNGEVAIEVVLKYI